MAVARVLVLPGARKASAQPRSDLLSSAAVKRGRFASVLHTTLPGAILLGALIFAPWFWGCTWPLGIHLLSVLLMSSMMLWAAGMVLRGKGSRLPLGLLVSIMGLLFQGWGLALNGKSICDVTTGLLLPVSGHWPSLPGSVDQDRSREEMMRLSGLLGAGLVAAWLGRSAAWRYRLLWVMVGTGSSIVFLGCWQRWTQAGDIFWNTSRHLDFFFATYRNVTNAGEYVGMIFPLAASLTLAALVKKQGPIPVAAGTAAGALLATGCCICGSKIAPLLLGLAIVLFVVMQWKRGELKGFLGPANPRVSAGGFVVSLAFLSILQSAGWSVTWERWRRVFADRDGGVTFSSRWRVDQVCGWAAPDAGWFGFGPGTFQSIFPYYSSRVPADLTGFWTYAHDDYAQTLLEWGIVGATLWSIYFFGAGWRLWQGWRRGWWSTENRILAAGMLLAGGLVAVMALVDFPLRIASIQLNVAVLSGLAWSSSSWPRARSGKGKGNPVAGGVSTLASRQNFLARPRA